MTNKSTETSNGSISGTQGSSLVENSGLGQGQVIFHSKSVKQLHGVTIVSERVLGLQDNHFKVMGGEPDTMDGGGGSVKLGIFGLDLNRFTDASGEQQMNVEATVFSMTAAGGSKTQSYSDIELSAEIGAGAIFVSEGSRSGLVGEVSLSEEGTLSYSDETHLWGLSQHISVTIQDTDYSSDVPGEFRHWNVDLIEQMEERYPLKAWAATAGTDYRDYYQQSKSEENLPTNVGEDDDDDDKPSATEVGNALVEAHTTGFSSGHGATYDSGAQATYSSTVVTVTGTASFNDSVAATDEWDPRAQPIVMDLDGDGVEVSYGHSALFDWDSDGYLERGSWTSGGDGFLVIDLDSNGNRSINGGDGVIDNAKEIVWTNWLEHDDDSEFQSYIREFLELMGQSVETDLQALNILERKSDWGDGNGVLNSEDAVWKELRIWQDLDEDGVTDAGELRSLSQWGITEIALNYTDGTSFSDRTSDTEVYQNVLHGFASYKHDGTSISVGNKIGNSYHVTEGVGDLALRYERAGSKSEINGAEIKWISEEDGSVIDRYFDLSESILPDLNLNQWFDGAYGDDRSNTVIGSNSTKNLIIHGKNGDDVLKGGWGNDTLIGGDGSDWLIGGDGDDQLFGGSGVDHLYGGYGNDILHVGTNDSRSYSIASGGHGDDLYYVNKDTGYAGIGYEARNGGFDEIAVLDLTLDDVSFRQHGGISDRMIIQGSGSFNVHWDHYQHLERISFSDGFSIDLNNLHRVIHGNGNNDSLTGSSNNDLFDAGSGNDTVYGNAGADTIFGRTGNDILDGGSGGDIIYGQVGNDTIKGGEGNDILFGGVGSDTIEGGAGDDFIEVGSGTGTWQSVKGQQGSDTYIVTAETKNMAIWRSGELANEDEDRVIFSDLGVMDIVATTGSAGGHAYYNFSHNDSRMLHMYDIEDIEQFTFADGTTVNAFSLGGSGREDLHGTSGNDYFDLNGNNAGSGAQFMRGGLGDDHYMMSGSSGFSAVWNEAEGGGNDRILFRDLTLTDLAQVLDHPNISDGLILQTENASMNLHINTRSQIESFEFADGTNIGNFVISDGLSKDFAGTSDDDAIYFGDYSGNGFHRAFGSDGDDVYVVTNSDRAISVWGENTSDFDTILFRDHNLDDLTIIRHPNSSWSDSLIIKSENGLNLHIHGEGDRSDNGIDRFVFADGTFVYEDEFFF